MDLFSKEEKKRKGTFTTYIITIHLVFLVTSFLNVSVLTAHSWEDVTRNDAFFGANDSDALSFLVLKFKIFHYYF
jgi:hypothetical protein